MIMIRNVFTTAAAGAALATTIGLAAAGNGSAQAGEMAGLRSYTARQAISHSFGSKRAIGYFAAQNGACALTLYLAEAGDGHAAPSAARVKFTVKPGDSAQLSSVEGDGLDVKCGKDAAAVEVRKTGMTTAASTN
jgi:hypothetical protein